MDIVDGKRAAQFLRVSYRTLIRWCAMGVGPKHCVIGDPHSRRKCYRFRISDLEAYLEERARSPRKGTRRSSSWPQERLR